MSSLPPLPSITCEKCKQGTMVAQRVPRMGNGLNVIGYTLIFPALLLLLGATACGVLMGASSSTVASDSLRSARARASDQLLDIKELPRVEAEAFRESGSLSDAALAALPEPARRRAESVTSAYAMSVAGTAAGTGLFAAAGGFGVIAAYVIGLPFLIVGLLLIRKKNVWRCPTCAYVFDRAS